MEMKSNQSLVQPSENVEEDMHAETIKKGISQNEEENKKSESFQEVFKERVAIRKIKEVKRNKEIENLTGHVKFLYAILNNVIFTLNQHAVVMNKELLPAKDKYLESKVMVKMFENIVSGTESVNLFNLLTQNDDVSIFKSSGEKKSSLGWAKNSNEKEGEGQTSPDKVEKNITSNANNVVGSSLGLSSGKQSKYKDSVKKPFDFSSEKKHTNSIFNSANSKSEIKKN